MKKVVAALIFLCLTSLSAVCVSTVNAQYQGNVTINADGSITPSTAPIQQTSNIYTFTSDVNGNITVNKSNTILEGNGHTISGGGFSIHGLSYVTIKNFVITDTAIGIKLTDTSYVEVVNNTITKTSADPINILIGWETTYAIEVLGGHSNTILGNNLIDNYDGAYLGNTDNNLIVANNFVNSVNPLTPLIYSYGLFVYRSSNNTIYHNNFFNNSVWVNADFQGNANSDKDDPYPNAWDNGYSNGGNYWSDYWSRLIDYQKTHPNAASIYPINKSNRDAHPLMEPFNTSTYLLEIPQPKIASLSPLNQTYNETSVTLVFTTDAAVVWMGYSLDGKDNVTVTTNTTIALKGLPNGLHNVAVYAQDAFGKIGGSETAYFTVNAPEPFPTVTVVAVLGASAVVIAGAGLVIYFRKCKRQV